MHYRQATMEDIEQLCELRKKQLIDEGGVANRLIDDELRQFFTSKMQDHDLIQILLEDEGRIVACGALVFYEFPPSFSSGSSIKGYVTNMYTEPNYRKRGIATTLLEKLVEVAKARQVNQLWLGASELGKPVYKKFGFQESDVWMDYIIE
ncbi:GNAT family N-acetyltransferase [Kurthia sibirica]|uniref:GNAT family N-acetyltransferase n=1 Tax=Kurthia sibirica TaxID=202750 RepID=A0A2U3APR8_9BACL|nr:GNAT family N-acetyltransferase [Kurthia sibirica]PWI26531.1 GNAT family N-acetyltransferase [Kurthia sibirica]GEK32776.1 N-acetyltransferase [Kurthia sibirica]